MVYQAQRRDVDARDGLWLEAYDLGAESLVGSIRLTGSTAIVHQTALLGERAVLNLGTSLVAMAFDGTAPKVLVTVSSGREFGDVVVSPDGMLIAAIVHGSGDYYQDSQVTVFEVATGSPVVTTPVMHPTLTYLRDLIFFYGLRWTGDGSSRILFGVSPHPEDPGILASVDVSGDVQLHVEHGWRWISPDGRLVLVVDLFRSAEVRCSLSSSPANGSRSSTS